MSGKANSETGYFRRMRSTRPKTALKNELVKLGIPPSQASNAINGASTSSVADQRHHVIGRASVPQIIGLLVCSPLRALSGSAPATATGLANRIRAEAARRNWFSDRQMRLLGTLAFR